MISGKFSRPNPMRTWWLPNWKILDGTSIMPVSLISASQNSDVSSVIDNLGKQIDPPKGRFQHMQSLYLLKKSSSILIFLRIRAICFEIIFSRSRTAISPKISLGALLQIVV